MVEILPVIHAQHSVAGLIKPEEVPSLQMLAAGGESLTPGVRNTWADTVTLLNG